MATELVPLFPLSVVLLPGTALPLHIFEPRYREMMGDVMAGTKEFGVVLAKEQGIVSVGCMAAVERVLQRYPDGRMDLLAIGQRRFNVVSLDEDKAYLRADVEFFNDEDVTSAPEALRQKAVAGFEALRKLEEPQVMVEPNLEGKQLSFQLGQIIADLDKRQLMLTLRSEVERLEFLVRTFPEYLQERERTLMAKRVAPLNGHAKHYKG